MTRIIVSGSSMTLSRVPGEENLYIGGIFPLRTPQILQRHGITHVLSVINYSLGHWGDEADRFQHMSIDIDDMDDEDILAHLPAAVRFIERGLSPASSAVPGDGDETGGDGGQGSAGSVFVHCAMGKSRSVSCVVAYLLHKHPQRFGGESTVGSVESAARRQATAVEAVSQAVAWVRRGRPMVGPNPGFRRQLELWWEMGCPTDDDRAVDSQPAYQRWLYERKLAEARGLRMAPGPEWIRFEDEAAEARNGALAAVVEVVNEAAEREVRCKRCRRVLAKSTFVVDHQGKTEGGRRCPCPHLFVETLSWMRPALEDGELDGRLNCPTSKCGATVGRFAWQGFKCSCGKWVCPAFSLNRSRVDEVLARLPAGA